MFEQSSERVNTLHPYIRESAVETLAMIEEDLKKRNCWYRVIVTQALRTFERQAELYARGRTAAGPRVTNARAGDSMHNYGFALDIALIDITKNKGNIIWDETRIEWRVAAQIFKQEKWTWGGDWVRFKDYPHFEKAPLPLKELRTLYAQQTTNTGYVNIDHLRLDA